MNAYIPEVGDYVRVPSCMLLSGVGKVVGFEDRRPVVQSVSHPNITVTPKRTSKVLPERCTDPEHPDCLASEELGIDCARWTRVRMTQKR